MKECGKKQGAISPRTPLTTPLFSVLLTKDERIFLTQDMAKKKIVSFLTLLNGKVTGLFPESFRNIVWGWPLFVLIVENL